MFLPTDRSVQFPNRYQLAPVSGTDNIADLTPAPGEVSDPGTLWNRQAARQMQADLRTLPIAPGYSVSAGDVVDVDGGQVVKTTTGHANSVYVVESGYEVDNVCIASLNETYSVCALHYPSYNNNSILLYLINNETGRMVSGSRDSVGPASSGSTDLSLSIARLSDSKFVIGYSVSGTYYANACTVSGTSISTGTRTQIETASAEGCVMGIDETSFACALNTAGLSVCTFSVSSENVITRTDYDFIASVSSSKISATLIPGSGGGTNRVCVCFADGKDGNKGKAVIATIDSANQVTWGSVVTFSDAAISPTSVASIGDTIVVLYGRIVTAIQANGNTLSLTGVTATIGAASNFSSIEAVGSSYVVAIDTGTAGNAYSVNFTGTAFNIGNAFQFNNSGSYYVSLAAVSDSELIIAYSDHGNSNYGTTTILEVMGNQIAGSFTDESSTAIALQSGTAGQSIECIFSGTTNAAWVTEGQVIDSPGVYGVGIMDGILQVWSKERPGRVVTGSYVGTGKYGSSNPNTLNFDSQIKCLIINGSSSSKISSIVLPYGSTAFYLTVTNGSFSISNVTWGETSVSWYTESSGSGPQANISGQVYHYIAIF